MKAASLIALAILAALDGMAVAARAATPTDQAFVAKVSQGGMFEVEAGKLAEQKGSTQDIRDFATMEVHDHVLVGNKLKAISASEQVAIAPKLNAEFRGKLDHLDGLSGRAFDMAYMTQMAAIHAADGAAFAKEGSAGGSPAYRAFGVETHVIVARHIGAIHAAPPPTV